jgi:hypothetical protein
MGRGRITPDETIEQIKATYAMNGNARETSRVLGVPFSTVRKHITSDEQDEFAQVRAEKRIDIIHVIGDAKIKLIEAMTDAPHLAKASVQELATAFGILQDKELLLTGQATSRTETITDPSARLTPDEMEAAGKIRAKLAAEATR